jgi:ankyrin repeat protein
MATDPEPIHELCSDELIRAIAQNDMPRVKELVELYNCDVNARNPNGTTPLHAAAFWGNYAIAKYLIRQGADPNAKNAMGLTPLHYAVLGIYISDALRRLINKVFGQENLHHVKLGDNLGVVKLLVRSGADPYAMDRDGFTVIDYAIPLEDPILIDYLLTGRRVDSGKNVEVAEPTYQYTFD